MRIFNNTMQMYNLIPFLHLFLLLQNLVLQVVGDERRKRSTNQRTNQRKVSGGAAAARSLCGSWGVVLMVMMIDQDEPTLRSLRRQWRGLRKQSSSFPLWLKEWSTAKTLKKKCDLSPVGLGLRSIYRRDLSFWEIKKAVAWLLGLRSICRRDLNLFSYFGPFILVGCVTWFSFAW